MPYNNTNPYSDFLSNWINTNKKNNVQIIDLSGGDRKHKDDRIINFDMTKYRGVDVIGNAHYLPFSNDSFDFVYSQASFEHYNNPFIVADEVYRICKPNGVIYVEIASVQSLHDAPYHFFNPTIYGAIELFKKFEVIDVYPFGNVIDFFNMAIRDAINMKLYRCNITQKIRIAIVKNILKDVKLKNVAFGVCFIGRKVSHQESHHLTKIEV